MITPNIQGNYEKVNKPRFYVFDVFDIDKQEYMLPNERQEFCKILNIPHIPIIDKSYEMIDNVDMLLDMAEGNGMNVRGKTRRVSIQT